MKGKKKLYYNSDDYLPTVNQGLGRPQYIITPIIGFVSIHYLEDHPTQ